MSHCLSAWRLENPRGGGLGLAEKVDYNLRPVRRGARIVAFDALFDAFVVGDYFIRVLAKWRDSEGCSGPQRAAWTFHVSSEA